MYRNPVFKGYSMPTEKMRALWLNFWWWLLNACQKPATVECIKWQSFRLTDFLSLSLQPLKGRFAFPCLFSRKFGGMVLLPDLLGHMLNPGLELQNLGIFFDHFSNLMPGFISQVSSTHCSIMLIPQVWRARYAYGASWSQHGPTSEENGAAKVPKNHIYSSSAGYKLMDNYTPAS